MMSCMYAGHAVESLYDLPMERRPQVSDVDSNAMQPCPAYERPDRCMRMCGNSHCFFFVSVLITVQRLSLFIIIIMILLQEEARCIDTENDYTKVYS